MAAWTTLSDAVLSAGKAGIQSIFRALRDNTIAAFEKQAGAPVLANLYVVEAMLAASSVAQAKLKTSTGTISFTVGTITLPGGEYGFWPEFRRSAGTGFVYFIAGQSQRNVNTFISQVDVSADPSTTGEIRQRYITASPPYHPFRADDSVPIFIFGMLHIATNELRCVWAAFDPPWANNGPTVINPLGRLQGFMRTRTTVTMDQVRADPSLAAQLEQETDSLHDFLHDPANTDTINREIARPFTQTEKNADMALIPHPFLGDLTGYRIVLINPTNDRFCRGLATRHEYLGDYASTIALGGYLILDNSQMPGLLMPPGVMAVRARWKLTP